MTREITTKDSVFLARRSDAEFKPRLPKGSSLPFFKGQSTLKFLNFGNVLQLAAQVAGKGFDAVLSVQLILNIFVFSASAFAV